MNNLSTYLKERVNPLLWLSLAAYLVIISTGNIRLDVLSLSTISFVFLFLVALRLFDDLFSAEIDQNKSNRSYTTPSVKRDLAKILSLFLVVFCLVIYVTSHLLIPVLSFLIINLLLYIWLFKQRFFQMLLPLLKYGFIVAVLQPSLDYLPLAILLLFVLFEIIDNQLHLKKTASCLIITVYALHVFCNPLSTSSFWVLGLGLTSLSLLLLNVKHTQYSLLILFLFSRLIL